MRQPCEHIKRLRTAVDYWRGLGTALLLVGCASAHPAVSAGSEGNPLRVRPALADVGFASPENLVYDRRDNVYLVSNINGKPRSRDANGFVSRVSPDGTVIALKWIDGSRPETRLDAPKGLAIRGDTLAIADVGCVRLFSLRTGTPLGVWNLPGVLMNDVSFAPDGVLYVTDTGPDPGTSDTADHDAVFRFPDAGHPVQLVRGADLSGPDGIVAADTGFVYATFGANRVERITNSGARSTVATLPGAKVDGLRRLGDGSFIVTSWNAHSVFRLLPDGTLLTIATGIDSPAGVAYDQARHQLAITSMNGNSMYFVTLK